MDDQICALELVQKRRRKIAVSVEMMSIRLALALFMGSLPQKRFGRYIQKGPTAPQTMGLQGCGASVLETQSLLERHDAAARNRHAFVDARNAQLDGARGHRLHIRDARQVDDIAAVNTEEAKVAEFGLKLRQRGRRQKRSSTV